MGDFFQQNLFLISIFYSLSFFVIFFAIVLEREHTANFEFVNTFMYLAGFGLLHGLGDILFVLPHAFSISQTNLAVIFKAAKYFIAGSYIFLYLFGLSVFLDKSSHKIRWVVYVSPVITLVLFIITINPFENVIGTEVIYRLFLGFPSAMLAAMALLKISTRFRQLRLKKIVVDFRGAAVSFLLYGIFAGLFFASYPKSILVLGIMPIQLLRALAAILIAFFTIRILAVFKL